MWTDLTDPGAPPPPRPATPTLEQYILAALAATALDLRDPGDCTACHGGELCPDHEADADDAAAYEAAYMQVAAGSAAYADFTIGLQARLN